MAAEMQNTVGEGIAPLTALLRTDQTSAAYGIRELLTMALRKRTASK